MVKTEKIEKDQVYTYKELCFLFEEPVKTSDSKSAQLKEWRRYFKWSNPTNRKYKIEEIYDAPRDKQDRRKYNGGNCTSKYLALDDVIMCYMEKKQKTVVTMSGLLVSAGLLSEEYIANRWSHKKYLESGFSEGVVNHVFWKMELVVNVGKGSLARLAKEGYLFVVKRFVLAGYHHEKRYLSENGSRIVEEIKDSVRKDMDLQPNELFNPKRREEYDAEVIKRIEEKLRVEVKYYYRVYDISATDKTYSRKTAEDVRGLTRKFVKSICMSIIKIDFGDRFYLRRETVIQMIRLVNKQFQNMSDSNWDEYGEEYYGSKISDADAVFWWCCFLPYYEWRLERDMKAIPKAESPENGPESNMEEIWLLEQEMETDERKAAQGWERQKVVNRFGEEQTREFERIIPNLDWEKVFKEDDEQGAYLQYIEYLLNKYYKTVYLLSYMRETEKGKALERVMNGAVQDCKIMNEDNTYFWLEALEPAWEEE